MIERRLNLQDVCALSTFSDDTVHRAIRNGELIGTKVRGRWLFKESHVRVWLAGDKTRSGSRREVQSRAA